MPRFTLPRRAFPEGPFTHQSLFQLTIDQIKEIPVTRENFLQLAYFLDPITASDINSIMGSHYHLSASDITDDENRMHLFSQWPSTSISALKPVLENYLVVQSYRHAKIYIPQIYFFDDETSSFLRVGPFLVEPCMPQPTIHTYSKTSDNISPKFRVLTEHPHVNSRKLCLGDESAAYASTHRSGDNLTPVMIIESVLQVYNPGSPYSRLRLLFPSTLSIPPIESNMTFRKYSDMEVQIYSTIIHPGERTRRQIGPFTLWLTDGEYAAIGNLSREGVRNFFRKIYDSANNPELSWHKVARLVLPQNENFTEAMREAGVNVSPGFNDSDALMNAIYTPINRSHCFDTSILPDGTENPDDTIQAEAGGSHQTGEAGERSSEEDDEDFDEDEEE